MTGQRKTTKEAARQLAEDGGKGFAGRVAEGAPTPRSGQRDGIRLALKRVGKGEGRPAAAKVAGKRQAKPASAGDRSAAATQAVLGRLSGSSGPSGAFDEATLGAQLDGMSADELQRLGRLVRAARTGKAAAEEPKAPLGRLTDELAGRGIHLDVDANNVTVNIGSEVSHTSGGGGGGWSGGAGRGGDWRGRRSGAFNQRSGLGYRLSRVKDFILGH